MVNLLYLKVDLDLFKGHEFESFEKFATIKSG